MCLFKNLYVSRHAKGKILLQNILTKLPFGITIENNPKKLPLKLPIYDSKYSIFKDIAKESCKIFIPGAMLLGWQDEHFPPSFSEMKKPRM